MVNATLERIRSLNGDLNAYVTVAEEQALAAAYRAEQKLAEGGENLPLLGVPVALKDIFYTEGVRTTMGTEFFKNFAPDYDATAVERLKKAGAVIVGKLNTHQFAYGPTGDRSYFGPARNPHDRTRITGGSSSGSGAAVAAHMAFAALGSDTGGSVRIPASCCGVVGIKPTFGRVSKHGVFPLAYTLDHVGPMTRTVRDNATLLTVLSGYDPRDPYSLRTPDEDFTRRLGESIQGSVVGVPETFFFEDVQVEVAEKIQEAVEVLSSLGAIVRRVGLGDVGRSLSAQRLVMATEAFTVHRERLSTAGERFEKEVRERLLTGEGVRAHDYVEAQQVGHESRRAFAAAFEEVDVLVCPTLPILPTEIDQREVDVGGRIEPVRSALTRLTGPTNLNGLPSLTVPCGVSESGLPIGLQLIGKPLDEANIYRFGHAFERATTSAP